MLVTYTNSNPQFQEAVVEGATGLIIEGVSVNPEKVVTYTLPDHTTEDQLAALDLYMRDLGYARVTT